MRSIVDFFLRIEENSIQSMVKFNPNTSLQARMFFRLCLLGSFFMGLFMVLYWLEDFHYLALINLIMLLGTLFLLVYQRWSQRVDILGFSVGIFLLFCLGTTCFIEQSIVAPTLRWIPIIPLVVLFFSGPRFGLVTLATTLGVSSFLLLRLHGESYGPPIGWNDSQFFSKNMEELLASILLIFTIGWFYDIERRKKIELLEKEGRLKEKLRESEMAVRKKEEAQALIGRLSHEINTPLNGISMRVSRAVKTLPEDQAAFLRPALDSIKKMAEMLKALREYSEKDDAGALLKKLEDEKEVQMSPHLTNDSVKK